MSWLAQNMWLDIGRAVSRTLDDDRWACPLPCLAFHTFAFLTATLHVLQGQGESWAVRRRFGLVVRWAGWHAGDPGSIPGSEGLYTFGCVPQRFESASAEILRYIKTPFIYLRSWTRDCYNEFTE
jgi:hypothetical protein